jgi:hypothetical protein
MKTTIALLAFSASLFAQSASLETVAVDFQVHYLGADTVAAKYGRKLPKSIFAGSVTGTNKSNTNVTFGQGYVLQVLRAQGYRALSQQDARAIVLKSQRAGLAGVWNRYSPAGVKILDDINNLQLFKVITLSPALAAGLATADAVAKATQTDLSTILADIYQTYETDGIQPLMQLAPGGSLVGTLLFEAEGAKPSTTNAQTFTIQIPVAGK